MKPILTIYFVLNLLCTAAQNKETAVLTLGTFHFNFPNLDVKKTEQKDQIDVLEQVYQKEIETIVSRIAKFKPTIIVIERRPEEQQRVDSVYTLYLKGKYQLGRYEEEQIGFRLAKQLGLKKLYCVDEWGNFNERLASIVFGKDSVEAQKFENYFEQDPDSLKKVTRKPIFKTQGILSALRQDNDEKNIKNSLGNYLTGLFKYESTENDFTGVDFETGRWFSRNLKIFRNIQRIDAGPNDRILVLYGADHLNLLNYFFECSPEYRLMKTNNYLQ